MTRNLLLAPTLALGVALILSPPALAQSGSGDVTGDGMVNVSDVQATINQALGVTPQTPQADVNGDGMVNVQDVQGIINIALGLVQIGVTNVTPVEPLPGDLVTIEAAGLAADPAQNLVDFNGFEVPATGVVTGGGGAPIAITLTLPVGARPGPMTVTVAGNALPPFTLNVRASLLLRVGPLPVTGATAEAFAITTGGKGPSLGNAMTNAEGRASIFFAADPAYSGPVLVELTGGDRVLLDTTSTPLTATWRAALEARPAGTAPELVLSPLSGLAVRAAEGSDGGLTAMSIPAARMVLRGRLAGLDPSVELPDPRLPPGAASLDQQEAALLCLALDAAADGLGVATGDALVTALDADLGDGALDGLNGGAVLLPEQGVIPTLVRAAFALSGATGLDPAYALREATLRSLLSANPSLGDPSLPGLDASAPRVLAVGPLHGAVDVATDARPAIAFSADVDPASLNASTVRLYDGATELLSALSFDATDAILTLTPSAPLPAGRELTLVVAAVRDLAGNVLAEPVTTRFTVGASTAPAPTLVAVSPASGSVLDPGATLRIEFSQAMNPVDIAAPGGLTLVVTPQGQLPGAVPIRVGVQPGARSVVVVPVTTLPPGASLSLGFGGSLRGEGAAILGATPTRTWTVRAATTTDSTAPTLTALAAGLADRRFGRQSFALSEALDPGTLTGRLTMLENSRALSGLLRLDASRGLLHVESAEPILAESDLTIQLAAGLSDAGGNAASALTLTREVRGLRRGLAWRDLSPLPVGLPGELRLAGQGGAAPYLFFLTSGSLPAGLNLTPEGRVHGTPAMPGSAAFEVAVIDANGAVAVEALTLAIVPAPGTATLSFAQTRIRVPSEQVGAVPIGIELSSTSASAFSLAVGIEPAGGTVTLAGPGADVGPTTLSAFFPAGSAGGTVVLVNLNILDDALFEAEETLRLRLGSVAGAAAVGGRPELVIELVDDEPEPELAFAAASSAVPEEGGPVALSVVASGPSSRRIRADLALSGDADRPGDISLSPAGRISLPALSGGPGGQTTLTLTPVDDAEFEPDETLVLDLVALDGARAGTPSRHIATVLDDDSRATLSVAAVTVDEGAGAATLTVTLSEITSGPVSVLVAVESAGVADSTDFTPTTETVTIPAGQLTASLTVPIFEDTINEPDEDLSVTLSAPVGARVGAAGAVTITDNDPLPAVSLADLTVTEGVGLASLAISVSGDYARPITLTVAVQPLAPASLADLGVTPTQRILAPGTASATLDLPVSDDLLHEPTESVMVTLSQPQNATLADGAAVLIVSDDDALMLTPDAALTVTEGNPAASAAIPFARTSADITLTLDRVSQSPVRVSLDLMSGGATTAAVGADFDDPSQMLTIPAGQTSATGTIAIVADNLREGDETFTLALSGLERDDGAGFAAAADLSLAASSVPITISDDDPLPTLSLSSAGQTVVEDVGAVTVELQPSHPSATPITVELAAVGDLAVPADVVVTPSSPLTIPAAPAGAPVPLTITFAVVDDGDSEAEESGTFSLMNPTGAGLGAQTAFTLTVTDDDTLPELSIADLSVAEDVGTASLAVTLTGLLRPTVSVTVTVSPAAGPADLGAVPTSLTIPPGQASASLDLPVLDDPINEPTESLTVTLSGASGATLADGVAVLTITDNDPLAASLADLTIVEGNAAVSAVTPFAQTDATLTISLDRASQAPVRVALATVDGTASEGADYPAQPGLSVTVPAGQTSATIAVKVLADNLVEPDESFSIAASAPERDDGQGFAAGADLTLAVATATITITDDDPEPTVELITADFSAIEDAGAVSFEVALSHPSASAVTVAYTTMGTATLGDDLTLSPASPLTIPAVTVGGAPVPVSLTATLVDDALDELTETLTLTLSAPSGAALGASTTVTLTLLDDDAPPQLAIQDLSVDEDVGSASLTITVAGLFTQPVSVDVGVAPQGPASAGDLGTLPVSLTIPAGSATAMLTLPVVDDDINEPDELFLVQLTNPAGATLTDGEAELLVRDDDTATVLATPFIEVTEGGAGTGGPPFSSVATSLAFALDRPSQGALRFELTTAAGTAGAGDFTALSAEPVTFAPGATMATAVLNVTADTIHEEDETLSVAAANLQRDDGAGFQSGNLVLSLSSVPVTIRDDDTLMVTIADIDELEGDQTRSVVVVVDFGIPSEAGATVTIDTGDISATAGSDFTALSGARATLTANGQTRQAVVLLEVLGDTELEVDESLTITASAPVAAGGRITLVRPQATVRLRNDDSISRIDTLVGDGTTAAPTAGAFGPKSALARPQGLAVDSSGNVYVASELQDRVLRVDPFGVVTVVAGDGVEDSDGDGGLAVDASVGRPQGLAINGAFLYIAEGVSNGGVRRVDLGSGLISRIATVNGIEGMALDGSGNLLAARPGSHEIVRVDVATGVSTRVAGTGSAGTGAEGEAATSSALRSPTGVYEDSNGDILIADTFNHRIRRVDSGTGLITTIAGNGVQGFEGDGGPALQARLNTPRNVTRGPAGELVFSDSGNDRVRLVDAAGDIFTVVGGGTSLGDGGPAGLAQLIEPRGVLFDSDGVLYVGDYEGQRVRAVVGLGPLAIARTLLPAVSIDSSYQGAIPASGGSNMGFSWSLTAGSLPNGVTLSSGTPDASLSGIASQTGVFDITVQVQDSQGATASRVFRIPQGGLIVDLLEPESGTLNGVAVSRSGDIYVTQANGRLGKRAEGSRRYVLLSSTNFSSNSLVGVREQTDEALIESNNLFAVHLRTGEVRGLASFVSDASVTKEGLTFICVSGENRVKSVAIDGTISNFAGNGTSGFGGDGGPALAAALNSPRSVVANAEAVFVGEIGGDVIRRVDRATGIITTAVGGPGTTLRFQDGGPAANVAIEDPIVYGLDRLGRLYFGSISGFRGMSRLSSAIVEPVSDGSVLTPSQTPAIDFQVRTLFKMPVTPGNSALLIPDSTGRQLVEYSGFERPSGLQITGAPRRFAVQGMSYVTSIQALSPEEEGYVWQVSSGALPQGVQLVGGIPGASLQGFPDTVGDSVVELTVTDGIGRMASDTFTISVFQFPMAILLTDAVAGSGIASLINDEAVVTDLATATLGKLALDGLSVLSFASNMPVEHGLTYDPAGNRYIGTSATDDRIRVVSGSGGMGSILAGTGVEGFGGDGGPAAMAQLHDPRGTALDASGVLYIADSGNHRVRVIDTTGTISTLVGTGTAGFAGDGGQALAAQLDTPLDVHIDGNRLLIADSGNFRIRSVDLTTGVISTVAGSGVEGTGGDDGAALSAELRRVSAIVTDSAGGIILADDVSETRIRRIDPATGVIRLMAGGGTGSDERVSGELIRLDGVRDLDLDRIGRIIVPSPGTGEVRLLGF